ncbi:MAG: hypothetical protein IPP72_10845 [Chitinophagaceae bacterium]|nr:hypothetical protein [Chitinophagaceae bacterium]
MVSLLYKWLLAFVLMTGPEKPAVPWAAAHPIFLSVTQIEHNAKEKTLEVSCKLFTDDFEKTLRQHYSDKIELLNEPAKKQMNIIVNDYIQKHFSIKADGKPVILQFIGFEQEEEGIISYFQASNIASVKKITVFNNLLYEYKTEQMGIIHAIVNGNRKSTRLNNPDANAEFEF